ncbi:MAG TPA: 4-hydroxy-tetrahydrodipicolinate synthase [bacterium]|nr:4-hydroxy-tetrahydrodipicolinate synthase [bacterium]
MEIKDLKGCGTALVTPFTLKGKLDENALKRLVSFQIEAGIDFLVPCGTTGENPTLTSDEHQRIVELVVENAGGKVPVIAGAGGYDTKSVIIMARKLSKLGADAILSVTPYYNKPTQEGLYQHYRMIAESVDLPIILYNVPGRTSVNLLPETVLRLSEIPSIIGIKEASGHIGQIGELAVKAPSDFKIISGDDPNTLPMMAMGAVGVISVISNQVPEAVIRLTHLCLGRKFREAMEIQRSLFDLMRYNFIETNPVPVKTGLSMMGLIEETVRLPLVPMHPSNREKLYQCLKDLSLIQ